MEVSGDTDSFNVTLLHGQTNFYRNIELNFGAAPQGTLQCSAPLQCSEEVQICGWTGKAIAANDSRHYLQSEDRPIRWP